MTENPHFRKYHGLGNDYLVIDPADYAFEPRPEAIRALCDRNRGPGADGILLGPLAGAGGGIAVRIFNPDGSEAEKSGNGTRIFARFLLERGYAKAPAFSIETRGGPVRATILDGLGASIRMDMGEASFDARSMRLATGLPEIVDAEASFAGEDCRITCVSMGNPHCVVTGLGCAESTARRIGPIVERDPLFPERTNVQFMEVMGPSEIRISVWERGAGFTLASGSSSCAAASAARRLGLVGEAVNVRMPGGCLGIAFEGKSVLMTGPVEKVYEGRLSQELAARLEACREGGSA